MYSNLASISVTKAFSKDVNILPTIREGVKSSYPNAFTGAEDVNIVSVRVVSESGFTVKLNSTTEMPAILVGSEYVLEYTGFIDYFIFDKAVTATSFVVGWVALRKEWFKVEIGTSPSGGTVVMKDGRGETVVETGEGEYSLHEGMYIASVSGMEGYDDLERRIFVHNDMKISLAMEATKYNLVFSLSPQTATVELRDSNEKLVAQDSVDSYRVVDGTYSYTVSAGEPYVPKTGTVTINGADVTETVTLTLPAKLLGIEIGTKPTKLDYAVGESFDPTGMVVIAYYEDETEEIVGDYEYSPTGALTTDDTAITVSYTENDVTVTADVEISVFDDSTPVS